MTTAGPLYLVYVRRSDKRAGDAEVSDAVQVQVARDRVPAGARIEVLADSGGHSSGADPGLPGWQAMLARIEAGGVVGVAAYDGSRLCRSVEKAATLLRLCRQHGVPD